MVSAITTNDVQHTIIAVSTHNKIARIRDQPIFSGYLAFIFLFTVFTSHVRNDKPALYYRLHGIIILWILYYKVIIL